MPPEVAFSSNLPSTGKGEFFSQAATWATLIGSRQLHVERVGTITVAAPKNDRAAVLPLAPECERATAVLAALFPDVTVNVVHVAAVDDPVGIPKQAMPVDGLLYVHAPRACHARSYARSGGI